MEKDYQFWNVLYENPNSGETILASVLAKTKKGAWSEAERNAEKTEWRVKTVTEMKTQSAKNKEGEESAEKTSKT